MTISHPPTDISFVRRRLSLSCRRRESESQSNVDSAWTGKVSPVSRINSAPNGHLIDMKSDTLFTALPVELRVEIFLQFCGMYCPIDKPTGGPVLLLKVCRAWTALALQTPSLWSSFALDFRPLPGPEKRDFLMSAMKRWIDRSRNLPLSFLLQSNYPVFDATCTNLLHCILPSSPRWRDVTLHLPSASLLPLWQVKPNSFPSLRTLTVETTGQSPFALGDIGFNWAQLTELNLFLTRIPTLDECLRILTQGVNLRRCTMNANCEFSSNDPEQRLALPRLEHLGLTMYGGRQETRFMEFLGALSLPGLQSLRIGWNVAAPGPNQAYYWSDGYARFIEFLRELRGQLKTLQLAYVPLDTRQLIECLGVVHSLRHLDITLPRGDMQHDSINDELLGALTQQPGCSGLVPYLQSIRLDSKGESFSHPALLRFIASRWRYQQSVSGNLERVELASQRRQAEYCPRRFKDLKEGKLEVGARLRSEFSMVKVISSFLDRDSYGDMICFLNGDFPSDIRSLLIFG